VQTFQEVVAVVEGHRGQRRGSPPNRRGDSGQETAWWLARRHEGMTLRQWGEQTGRTDHAAVEMALKTLRVQNEGGPGDKDRNANVGTSTVEG